MTLKWHIIIAAMLYLIIFGWHVQKMNDKLSYVCEIWEPILNYKHTQTKVKTVHTNTISSFKQSRLKYFTRHYYDWQYYRVLISKWFHLFLAVMKVLYVVYRTPKLQTRKVLEATLTNQSNKCHYPWCQAWDDYLNEYWVAYYSHVHLLIWTKAQKTEFKLTFWHQIDILTHWRRC